MELNHKKDHSKINLDNLMQIIKLILSISCITLLLIARFGNWSLARFLYEPLFSILMIVFVRDNWRIHRKMAYLELVIALFIFAGFLYQNIY